jgi:hypothetical protein
MQIVITEEERKIFARVGAEGGRKVRGAKKRRSMAHYQRAAAISSKVRRENAAKRKKTADQ